LIDEREPALAGIGRAPWVIRASEVRPETAHASRPATLAPAARASGGDGERITWSPANRLAVAVPGADAPEPSGETSVATDREAGPDVESVPMPEVRVSLEPPSRARWGWLPWIGLVIALIGALLWWRSGGAAS